MNEAVVLTPERILEATEDVLRRDYGWGTHEYLGSNHRVTFELAF